ncbi:hypothetical protein MIR68_003112 [Amoeboaphelidium protococcarum]|nr:hypothetical protein MIR68_003112 [Amoeboaphelidium protococcarum]
MGVVPICWNDEQVQDKDIFSSTFGYCCVLWGYVFRLEWTLRYHVWTNSPYYTDTDSIQIHARNLRGLVLNNEIGGISDHLGDNCKILYGGWIAPKLYFLEYVEKHGDVEEIKYHLRGKGIPKSQLNVEMFESMMLGKSITIDMHRDFKRVRCKSKFKATTN